MNWRVHIAKFRYLGLEFMQMNKHKHKACTNMVDAIGQVMQQWAWLMFC